MNTMIPMLALTLAGTWRFSTDPEDRGINEQWFQQSLPEQIQLPGTLTGQGIGNEITTNTPWVGGIQDPSFFAEPEYEAYRQPGEIKIPFWLQPDLYYAGAAWFQREIEVPADWENRRAVLMLERAHWETQVWIDGNLVGTNRSLATPHVYDLGRLPPGEHALTVRVDNRSVIDIGHNSHAVSDHTQGNWNGIVGRIELQSTPLVWLEDVQLYPGRMRVELGNASGEAGSGELHFGSQRAPIEWSEDGASIELELDQEVPLWDEFNPGRHELTVRLVTGWGAHERDVPLGRCDIEVDGTQFVINGRESFLRGTLECAIFPRTGHPPMEIDEWRRVLRTAQAHGLNHLRFHSWCPPEVAFQAADELGVYFQVETCWPNQSTRLGEGQPVDQWARDETDRILKAYGNHPSFVLMAHGNEPGGKQSHAYLSDYVEHYREVDPRRLWTSGAGWPELPENEFHVTHRPRVQQWGEGLKSRVNAKPPETTTDYRAFVQSRTVPVVSHEIGQWCVYPNFEEIPKYTGYLKPKNFEIFRDRLEANGLLHLAKPFLMASGKLQTLCYKEDIESALRTPGMGGFQLLDLHDFPGQGTALVGVLDPFWEGKGYVTADAYRRFCDVTVPLARLPRRVFTVGESLEATIDVAHYGAESLGEAVVAWKLVGADGSTIAEGQFEEQAIPVGGPAAVGQVAVNLTDVEAPAQYRLVVGLRGTNIENDWPVWVYPPAPEKSTDNDVLVTATFDDAARARLEAGGTVLLTVPGDQVRNYDKNPVKLGFSSIFWNTAWTHRQAPTTLGILCDPDHPALAAFPTESHSNWQWWYLMHRAEALRLDVLPPEVEPIVRVIDDWVTARPLGLVVEGRVGAGRIVICGFDLTGTMDDPVSRQMRTSLLRYINTPKCDPTVTFSPEQIESLVVADLVAMETS